MVISAWPSSSRAPYPSMLYFRTHGKGRRSPSKSCRMEPARRRLATRRYGSAQNRRSVMACNTFGWTHAASTSRAALSFLKRLIPCFAGTVSRLNVTFIYQMCRNLLLILTTCFGNRHFGTANGSLEAGPFKSSLLRHPSNSFRKKGSCWATN